MGFGMPVQAVQLRVHGTVTDHSTRLPLAKALVRVYRNGVRVQAFETGANGSYSVLLDNNAENVIRFSSPGRVTKCFSVDTNGPEWEGDARVNGLVVEMTLFEPVEGVDLAYFDLPMGMARFTPMTGMVSWNAEYEERVRPVVDRLMAEVALRRQQLVVSVMREPASRNVQ